MGAGDDGTARSAAEDGPESGWSEWIRPEAAAFGVAGVVASAVVHSLADPQGAAADDEVAAPAGDGDGDSTDEAWEQISRDTQQVADHGVTLMAMDGVAQAQLDTIESFNPSNY